MEMRESFFFERGKYGTTQIPLIPMDVTLRRKLAAMIGFFKVFKDTIYIRSNGDITANSDDVDEIVLASIEEVN